MVRRPHNPCIWAAPTNAELLDVIADSVAFGAVAANAHPYLKSLVDGMDTRDGQLFNVQTSNGMTPLMLAAARGYIECVWWLLEGGADPIMEDDDGETALAAAETSEVAGLLLDRGLDPLVGHGGWQALRLASHEGNVALASRLLDAGVAPDGGDEFDPDGPTPMMLACFEGHLECVKLLSLARAGRVSREWAWPGFNFAAGDLVEEIALARDHEALADWLRSSREWCTALHHLEIVTATRARRLLQCGADVLAKASPGGSSPLSLARELRHAGRAAEGSAAHLVLLASVEWAPATHRLFPLAARRRAAAILRLGYLLSARFGGSETAWTDLWRAHLLPLVVTRHSTNAPTADVAQQSTLACQQRDPARGVVAAAPAAPAGTSTEQLLRKRIQVLFTLLTTKHGMDPQQAATKALELARRSMTSR